MLRLACAGGLCVLAEGVAAAEYRAGADDLVGDISSKSGQQFSALQFLLSSDRQHYASLPIIWLRYAVLHGLVIAALASLQWPHFRAAQRYSAHASH